MPGEAAVRFRPPVTDVADMDALVRLAKRDERLILDSVKGDEHIFVVDDAGSVYQYRVREISQTLRRPPRHRGQAAPTVPQPRTVPDTYMTLR